jgi:hypothetical protein
VNERDRQDEQLESDRPVWEQPADPFQGLPSPERATCDRDWVL